MSLKSSIFTNPTISAKPSSSSFNATGARSRLSSPYINGLNSSPTPKDRLSDAKLRNESLNPPIKTTLMWDFEEILESYRRTGDLPPPLSPTIPQIKTHQFPNAASPKRKSTKDQKKESQLSNKLNSPILIHPKSSSIKKDIFTAEKENALHGYTSSQHASDNKAAGETSQSGSHRYKVSEDMPLLMLSPTLPTSFSKIQHSAHSKSDKSSSDNLESKHRGYEEEAKRLPTAPIFKRVETNVGVFKWINKMHDTAKPKFLVRVIMNNKMKFKERISSPSSFSTLNGLKIITQNQTNERSIVETNFRKFRSDTSETKHNRQDSIETKFDPKHQKKPLERALTMNPCSSDIEMYKSLKDKQEKEIEKLVKFVEEKDKLLKDSSKRLKALEREIEVQLAKNEPRSSQKCTGVFINETIGPEQPPLLPELKLTKTQVEDVKTKLTKKKKYWLDICKNVQADIDKLWKTLELTRGSFPENWKVPHIKFEDIQVIVMQVDVCIMKMVSLDYDERSKVVTSTLPSERSWKALDIDVEGLITYIELLLDLGDILTTSKEIPLEVEFLKTLKCLLFQTRALIVKRINSILLKVVDTYIKKMGVSNDEAPSTPTGSDDITLSRKIIQLQQQNLKNSESLQHHFVNSQPEYLNSMLASTFSCVWERSTSNILHAQQSYNLDAFDKSIKPSLQTYYLPMGIYSNLNEVNCVLFNVVVYFLETYNKMNPDRIVNYKLQSGLT